MYVCMLSHVRLRRGGWLVAFSGGAGDRRYVESIHYLAGGGYIDIWRNSKVLSPNWAPCSACGGGAPLREGLGGKTERRSTGPSQVHTVGDCPGDEETKQRLEGNKEKCHRAFSSAAATAAGWLAGSPGPFTRTRSGRILITNEAACRPATIVVNTDVRNDCPTCLSIDTRTITQKNVNNILRGKRHVKVKGLAG